MKKKVYKHFIDCVDKQEKWLNKMAVNGLRLVRCGKLSYEFEQCNPGEYQYCVEFVGERSYAKQKDYKCFLEGLGYSVHRKNINLNWSFGKVRFRPWADGAGKFLTSPGTYNKELLIVEKISDGKPFDIHTDTQDLATHLETIRNLYSFVALLGIVFSVLFMASIFTEFNLTWGYLYEWCGGVLFGLIGVIGAFVGVKYGLVAKQYRELRKTNE